MPKTLNKEFLIVDGSHYLYRAYYGVPETAKLRSGLQVNAVYGFMANLRKAVKVINPSHIFVVFDSETGIKDKVQENASYKSNRDYSDVGMYKQLPLIQRILTYLEIKYIEPSNHEADDYIGSLAKHVCKYGYTSTVFSNDADFLQLIDDNIQVVKVGRKFLEIINGEALQKIFGFNADQYAYYLSLKGDSSDNIRGVPGIGPKTAQNLIKEFGSLEKIFSNMEKLSGKTRDTLQKNKDLVNNNFQILKINTDILETTFKFKEYSLKNKAFLNESTNFMLSKIGVDTK